MSTFHVKEIWRYPVKSMQGEKLEHCMLTKAGIPLDRGWAVRDEATQTIRGAKHIAGLMNCSARYIEGTNAGAVPHVAITLPDGATIRSDDAKVNDRLSQALDRRVTLWPLLPADKADHYRINGLETADTMSELRMIFALEPNEPMADLTAFPQPVLEELMQFAAPRGTYFDAFPVNVLTEASIRHLQTLTPASRLDVRRFRPNFLLADDDNVVARAEDAWIGREVALGKARINVAMVAPRCIMTTRAQMDLPRDPEIMRTMVRETAQCLSIYADVVEPGAVSLGDAAAPLN